MIKTKKHIKASASIYVVQSKKQASEAIKYLGDIQRELTRLETEMNDKIADITGSYSSSIEVLKKKSTEIQKGIQIWCEANRDELTNNGKVKSANLTTGEVQWRNRPPSCVIRGIETVIESLKSLGLNRFIRTKEEINKDAILNEPNVVAHVPGITIKKDIEDFAIVPFEQEVV
ncbi:host-nuclease inhibitor Gam family protein [Gilliamella sp. B3464]|uniref:host-nuclease inhibitor Gam family protein n=1 Tax=unclassified Gilliamella TaxID=2685620 RepID=UPI00226AC585|nr:MULTISPECIES: host-nuclease inhibitor Gam family protein [unclassified Gilliamella]MCX8712320.1 host-nuclease inhibitor Gam family protein [Gilliamella sp. B3468]MCX8751134.1 host-nuclease inhibitor Gam family protein [Gilliamella sp. B3464]